ncbi:thioredoxin domain-containing protein [Leifsonia sp. NCR5]|uniref:DsbA family protein n=1 Tax=Leifsonia sp. NCR5 TaxID=1978342 RepID=UPI000A18EF2C|nr:thioredoxin domain-containing protein [Leifsonia sp. NCR5]
MTDLHPKIPKRDRRDAARIAARALREEERRRSKRRRLFAVGGGTVGIVAIGLAVTMGIMAAIQPPPAPRNTQSGAIVIGDTTSGAVRVVIYQDYLCPHCGTFESTNGQQLASRVAAGTATLEVHPLAILTTMSSGTKYSLRAANAAVCVADHAPASFLDFNQALFAHQPAENTPGLTDAEIKGLLPASITGSGVVNCIDDGTFNRWVQSETNRATTTPVPGTDLKRIVSTPTVLIDGTLFSGDISDPAALAAHFGDADR